MPAPVSWPPPNSVLFAASLCLLLVVGELIAAAFPDIGNPSRLAFFCFLPVALWMMTAEQRRDARTIRELEARIVRLEEALADAGCAEHEPALEATGRR